MFEGRGNSDMYEAISTLTMVQEIYHSVGDSTSLTLFKST